MNTYVVLHGRNRVCVLSCVPVFSREFHVPCATAQLGCVTFLGVKNIIGTFMLVKAVHFGDGCIPGSENLLSSESFLF